MDKEQWKDRIMGSLEGLQRAEPHPGLYGTISARLTDMKPAGPMTLVRRPYLALAAASLALLLMANVWVLKRHYPTAPSATEVSVYQLEYANFDLY